MEKRENWGSKIGFMLAAIGSAVGLGNIWGFPYKMGANGGFAFLVIYLVLAVFVGVPIMKSELSIGRKTGQGVVGAYNTCSKKFKWVGWTGVVAPFLILMFYCVLGAYCIEYMFVNFSDLAMGIFGASGMSGMDSFLAMITNPLGCVLFTLLFILVNVLIVKSGLTEGIEKFNKVGMPALVVMLLIIIIRSCTLPGAGEGLKFMLVPNFEPFSTFGGFIHVLSVAGGQMFFSLSLAMGIMITYGSFLPKDEDINSSSVVIVAADTIVAFLAGFAVIPAAFALGGEGAYMAGPKLLFVTMQDVFAHMGTVGPIFGVIFYGLVIIAALSSSISLAQVLVTFISDKQASKGKTPDNKKISWWVHIVFGLGAILVAWDGLGANGVWVPFQNSLGVIGEFNDCWLDFLDFFSEGIAMPIGALLMSIMVGWELKPKYVLDEIGKGDSKFYNFCIKFICPIAMLFVLLGQVSGFLGLGWF